MSLQFRDWNFWKLDILKRANDEILISLLFSHLLSSCLVYLKKLNEIVKILNNILSKDLNWLITWICLSKIAIDVSIWTPYLTMNIYLSYSKFHQFSDANNLSLKTIKMNTLMVWKLQIVSYYHLCRLWMQNIYFHILICFFMSSLIFMVLTRFNLV